MVIKISSQLVFHSRTSWDPGYLIYMNDNLDKQTYTNNYSTEKNDGPVHHDKYKIFVFHPPLRSGMQKLSP